jgi:hypothetical protein
MVLFLIFWAAYITPIAIPLLWLVFTIVMHSRQAKPRCKHNSAIRRPKVESRSPGLGINSVKLTPIGQGL